MTDCKWRQPNPDPAGRQVLPNVCYATAPEDSFAPAAPVSRAFCGGCAVPALERKVNCIYFRPYCLHTTGPQTGEFMYADCPSKGIIVIDNIPTTCGSGCQERQSVG